MPTLLCREVTVLVSYVLKEPGLGVDNLHVTCEILFSPNLAEVIEVFISNIRYIKLMVACIGIRLLE